MFDFLYPQIAPHLYLDIPGSLFMALVFIALIESTTVIDTLTSRMIALEHRMDNIIQLNQEEINQNKQLDTKLDQILTIVSKK